MSNEDYIIKLRKKLYNAQKSEDILNSLLVCERLLRLYKDENLEENYDFAEDMYRIGTVFLNTGRIEKGILALEKADEVVKNIATADSLRANILNNLAICFVNKNDLDKARKCFKEALSIVKLIKGEDSQEYIELLCNIGNTLFDKEDYDKAIYYHFEALNKRKSKDLGFADNLNYLGYDFEAKGETDNALNYFEQALAIIKTFSGPTSTDYMANSYYLASVYEKNEQYDKALKLYDIVVEKFKETCREEHPYYAEALSKMSNVCVKLENYQRALMLSLKATSIVKKAMGENHIYYANSLKTVADIYIKTNDFDRAISLYKDEIKLKQSIFGNYSDVTIKAVLHLCDVYIKGGEPKEAQELCQTTIKNIDSKNVMYFDCLLGLVRIYTTIGNVNLLYSVYEMAKTLEPTLGFDDMLKKAFSSDTANNTFATAPKAPKEESLAEEQMSLDLPDDSKKTKEIIEEQINNLSKNEDKEKRTLNESEIYEQESFDSFFKNDLED